MTYIVTKARVFLYHSIFVFTVLHTTSCMLQSNAPEVGHNYFPTHVELTLEF